MAEAEIIRDTTHERELAITLIPSPDDPPKHEQEYQAELGTLAKEMRGQGIDFSSRAFLMESASGGGFTLGEFYAVVKTVSPAFAGLIGVWLQKKYGRKVKLKYKDVQIEATTVDDVEKLIKLVREREKN
jgi:hypothetical protein